MNDTHRNPLPVARGGLRLVARLVWIAAGLAAAAIAVGIAFVVLEANPRHEIVATVSGIASDLVGPFKRLFRLDSPKLQVLVNWGIAAGVYLLIGGLVASLLRRGAGVAR